jgi:adenosine deaminase
LGLGYPVSISPDDPGKFAYEDSTADYFTSALSYNWSLRHLKLVGYHSINHSVCEEAVKTRLIANFEKTWDEWVHRFLEIEHVEKNAKSQFHYEDIFTFSKNWSFKEE